MNKAEIEQFEQLEADLRLHKEDRLRLRKIELRLTRELEEARALLREVWTILAAGSHPYDDESLNERVALLKHISKVVGPTKVAPKKCFCGQDAVYYGMCRKCADKVTCHGD